MSHRDITRRAFHAAAAAGVVGALGGRVARGADPVYGAGVPLNGLRIFPSDNPWNQDISKRAVDPMSARILYRVGLDKPLHPDFGTVYQGAPNGIPYVVVRGTQLKVPVTFRYASESDPGPYPVPSDAPIEGGPTATGDRHILIIDRDNAKLYELFSAYRSKIGNGWDAGGGAIFNLNSNVLRPAGWTSADAAGLPIFPGLARYEEAVTLGAIRHALRFTVAKTRRGYVSPARHFASSATDVDLPPMGMRVRLKANYDIRAFPAQARVILTALKTYGMFLADNGGDWFLSGAPDPRWNDDDLHSLKKVKVRDFEVVTMGTVVTR